MKKSDIHPLIEFGKNGNSVLDIKHVVRLCNSYEEEIKSLKADNKEKDSRISALCNPPHRGVYE